MRRRILFPLILLLVLAAAAAVIFLLHGNMLQNRPIRLDPEGLYVLFIDVGQGDAALIMQGGHAMLVDTGLPEYREQVEKALSLFGIRSLDAMLLTHPHADHIGSAAALLERYPTSRVFLPNAVTTTAAFDRLLDTILDRKIPTSAPVPGETWMLGGAELTFLSPPSDMEFADLNDASIVFRLSWQDHAVLFTGDAGTDAEQRILDEGYPVRSDLIKVPHHGSLSSSSPDFLHAVSPRWAVFTTVRDSEDGLPKKAVVERYAAERAVIFFTHLEGSIWAEIRDGDMRVMPFDREQVRRERSAS